MGTRQGNSAGITHDITHSVPSNRRKKLAKLLTELPRVLSSVAVSLVKR